ncbi:MAG: SGNH/GDSL hydrolase family protein [Thermodesulfobacteriota bacterium]
MKRYFQLLFTGIKWLIVSFVFVEILSFLVITASNYWIYGQVRDGDPVRYDPYALFVSETAPRPTVHNPPAPDRAKYRLIWLFGGSTMKGATDYDDKTIPSFLARDLNQVEPLLPAYLVNFGEPSFNSLMETKYLEKALIEQPEPPDILIFYDGANDCAYFAQSRTPYAHHGYRRLRGLIESYHHSFFGLLKPLNAALYASFTHELYDKIRQGVIPLSADDPQLLKFVDTVEKRYDYINRTALSSGTSFLLFWQPFWWVETEPVSPAVRQREEIVVGRHLAMRHNFEVINRALAARLKDKPYFIDFRNALCARTQPAYQADGIHLQDVGDEMVAGQMARYLKSHWLRTAAVGGSSR